jgi:hypothetical protein
VKWKSFRDEEVIIHQDELITNHLAEGHHFVSDITSSIGQI